MQTKNNTPMALLVLTLLSLLCVAADGTTATREEEASRAYELARVALAEEKYREAVEAFRQLSEQHAQSKYAADARYWEALALYRLGSSENLRQADQALEHLLRDYPQAAVLKDASELAARIQGELAQRGDAGAAAEVLAKARALASAKEHAQRGSLDADRQAEDETRMVALNALYHMDRERALPIVHRLLKRRDDDCVRLREQAIFLLVQEQTPEVEAMLLEIARQDPDPGIRGIAVHWLSRFRGEDALALLEEILHTEKEPDLLEQAAFALTQIGTPRAIQMMMTIAADDSTNLEVRRHFLHALAQLDEPAGARFLWDLYPRLTNGELKEMVVSAPAHCRTAEGRRWLMTVARDANEPLSARRMALHRLAADEECSAAELIGLYPELSEPLLREQLIFALSRCDDLSALEMLMEIARNDPDERVRQQVIFWIAESDDPRVVAFLEEIAMPD